MLPVVVLATTIGFDPCYESHFKKLDSLLMRIRNLLS